MLDTPPSPDIVAGAVDRFRAAGTFPVLKHAKSGVKRVDAHRFVRALEVTGPAQLRLEIAMGPDGTIKPGAVLAELLPIAAAELPTLRVCKTATRFHADGAQPDAAR